jgi:hypothetical protein
MAFLMNIAFDNTVRLQRRTYLLEYKGFRFKLVQNDPRRHHDHLLTIIPRHDGPERDQAFAAAAEFVSALAWQSGAAMTVWDSGGRGWDNRRSLRSAIPTAYGFPRVPFHGHHIGGTLISIPHVQTAEQRVALALFREARASNSHYLSLLFFWQVLGVSGGSPQDFIENVMKNSRHHVPLEQSWFDRLPLKGRSIGKYLKDDCRHAVAHIKRFAGIENLDLDDWKVQLRFTISVTVARALAEAFIRHHLGMSSSLSLVRPRGGGFPRFVDRTSTASAHFYIAYPGRPFNLKRIARPHRLPKLPSRRFE